MPISIYQMTSMLISCHSFNVWNDSQFGVSHRQVTQDAGKLIYKIFIMSFFISGEKITELERGKICSLIYWQTFVNIFPSDSSYSWHHFLNPKLEKEHVIDSAVFGSKHKSWWWYVSFHHFYIHIHTVEMLNLSSNVRHLGRIHF